MGAGSDVHGVVRPHALGGHLLGLGGCAVQKEGDRGLGLLRQRLVRAQEHRDGFAALLTDLPPNREWKLDPESENDRHDALLARYILFHDVIENNIIFILRELGMLDYSTWRNESESRILVRSVSINRFGRRVMALFARRAAKSARPRGSTPLDRLQETLFI